MSEMAGPATSTGAIQKFGKRDHLCSCVRRSPSIQDFCMAPIAVMARRFMNGSCNILADLQNPPKMKITVETLGFLHLVLEVTVPRVIIFRDAILDLLEAELGSRMPKEVRTGLSRVLSWVGVAYVYIRREFAGRLRIIAKSWSTANNKKLEENGVEEAAAEGETTEVNRASGEIAKPGDVQKKPKEGLEETSLKKGSLSKMKGLTTFIEMFAFNNAVMGLAGRSWVREVFASFDSFDLNVDAHSLRMANGGAMLCDPNLE